MSFLDESSATLQESLAFIDACESTKNSNRVSDAAQRKPRKGSKPGYWERIRAEGDSLREEATALERTLQQLQAQAVSHFDRQPWMLVGPDGGRTHVEREYKRRLKAEGTNQGLKGLIATNCNAIEALAALSFQVPYARTDTPVLLALLDQSSRLASDAQAILDRVGLSQTDSFLFRTQREIDSQFGAIVESVSSTPLAIKMQQADIALWQRLLHDSTIVSDRPVRASELQSSRKGRTLTPCLDLSKQATILEGGYTKAYPSTFAFGGQSFKLTSHMLLRRHVCADKVVYVWVASTSIPGTNVQFIEDSLISVREPTSNTSSSAKRAALLQCWYRLRSEQCDVPSSKSNSNAALDLELLIENAMRMRSNFGISYIQSLENHLMNETKSNSTGSHAAIAQA